MNAKELFESLGYHRYANNKKIICYVANEDYKRIKFKLEQNKLTIHSDVNMELLGAIIKQCIEIGWQPVLEVKQ